MKRSRNALHFGFFLSTLSLRGANLPVQCSFLIGTETEVRTPCLPLEGKRSVAAVVNDSPVGCQSRGGGRSAERWIRRKAKTEGVSYRWGGHSPSLLLRKIQPPLRGGQEISNHHWCVRNCFCVSGDCHGLRPRNDRWSKH